MNHSPKNPPALWALALGAFAIGMTEFVAIGLLNSISQTFNVSVSLSGWVVTAYALGVMVGAPLMTWASLRIPRKSMLVLLMVIFTVGNLFSALAPTFAMILIGRVITSLTHGVFFGMGSIVAAELVGPARRAGAVAFMFTGLTLANLVGVPAGTWIGATFGWRASFGVIAVIGALVVGALVALVPHLEQPTNVDLKKEISSLKDVNVILALLMTLLGFGGVFAAITYLTPITVEVTGLQESSMTWMLAILGVGMLVGNLVGGKMADKVLMPTVIGALVALMVALAVFIVSMHSPIFSAITVFFIGAVGFATVPPLQTVVLDRASHAPTLASALNIGAFNLGNAVAAWLAGKTIETSWGYPSAALVGVGMTAIALVLALVSLKTSKNPVSTSENERELVAETV